MLTLTVFVCFVLAVTNGVTEIISLPYFPYAASLRIFRRNICGATMIKRNVLLTAAICVWKFRNLKVFNHLTVHAGTIVDCWDAGEIIGVKRLHFFPNDTKLLHNVAVLRMKKKFTLGEPIEMRHRGAFLPRNRRGNLTGWVRTELFDLPGRPYTMQNEEVTYLGSQDNFRNFQCETKRPSKFTEHKGDPVVTDGFLVGISFVHDIKVREDSYQTLVVNISHPKIWDFIMENTR